MDPCGCEIAAGSAPSLGSEALISLAATPGAAAAGSRPCCRSATASARRLTRCSRSGRQAVRSSSLAVFAWIAAVLLPKFLPGACDLVHVLLHGRIHGLNLSPSLSKTTVFDELRRIAREKGGVWSLIPSVRIRVEGSIYCLKCLSRSDYKLGYTNGEER